MGCRIARPTDNLKKITQMYVDGLGFSLLASFENHNGFDGSIIGHQQHNYHLEFTHHRGSAIMQRKSWVFTFSFTPSGDLTSAYKLAGFE